MPKFRYQAMNAEKKSVFGELKAETLDEALATLKARGLEAKRDDVTEMGAKSVQGEDQNRLNEQQAVEVARHVAELAKAGLPLGAGLRALAQEISTGKIAQALARIADRLDAGHSLEDAIGQDKYRFPPHLRGLILAGGRTGHLPEMLDQYICFHRNRSDQKRQIWTSLAYPLLLLTMTLLLFMSFSVYIVPEFADILEDFGTTLPVFTRVMFFVCNPNMGLLVCLPAFMLYIFLFLATTRISVWGQRALYMTPLLGPLWQLGGMISFCQLLGLLVGQKVPLPESLELAAEGIGEPGLAIACRKAAKQVQSGRSLAESLAGYWQFPPMLLAFAEWGQRSECLAEALHDAAEVFQRRLGVQICLCNLVLPPLMFMFILVTIGFLVVGLMLPILNLISNLFM